MTEEAERALCLSYKSAVVRVSLLWKWFCSMKKWIGEFLSHSSGGTMVPTGFDLRGESYQKHVILFFSFFIFFLRQMCLNTCYTLCQKAKGAMMKFWYFSLKAWKNVVSAFLHLLDGDALYLNTWAKCLQSLNTVHHCPLKLKLAADVCYITVLKLLSLLWEYWDTLLGFDSLLECLSFFYCYDLWNYFMMSVVYLCPGPPWKWDLDLNRVINPNKGKEMKWNKMILV